MNILITAGWAALKRGSSRILPSTLFLPNISSLACFTFASLRSNASAVTCIGSMNGNRNLLEPFNPTVIPVCGFKVKGLLKRRCKDCFYVVRQERLYILCKTHPRHKQMAMKAREHKSWILTHATQGKFRPW